jgi:hypothetical protein
MPALWRNILAPSSELKNIDISSTVSYEDSDGILDTPRTEAVQNLCGQGACPYRGCAERL